MAIPFLILAGATALSATGIITGVDGTIKITDSKRAIETAEKLYEDKKFEFDVQKNRTISELERLGYCQQKTQSSFIRFADAYEKVVNRPPIKDTKTEKIEFEDISLDEIKSISIKALDLLGGTVLSLAAGAATGAVAYGGTMTFGIASTGTAISTLHGVAAKNAALAVLGGGAKGIGGGMALGAKVLGGAVAAPVIAVSGLLVQAKAKSSIEKSEEIISEIEDALQLMNKSLGHINKLRHLSMLLRDSIEKLYEFYLIRVSQFEELVERETDYMKYTEDEKDLIENNKLIVKYLAHLTRLSLIKVVGEEKEEVLRSKEIKKEINNIKINIPVAF